MTDKEKLNTIKSWVNESISQGNAPILAFAIRDILNQKENSLGLVKLSQKSLEILKRREINEF